MSVYVCRQDGTVDGKGRVTLPADLRVAAENNNKSTASARNLAQWSREDAERAQRSLSLLCHVRDGERCVVALDAIELEAIVARLEGDGGDKRAEQDRVAQFFSQLSAFTFDSAGRGSLPQRCRDHLGLDAGKSQAVEFFGRSRVFEIWPEGGLARHLGQVQAREALDMSAYV